MKPQHAILAPFGIAACILAGILLAILAVLLWLAVAVRELCLPLWRMLPLSARETVREWAPEVAGCAAVVAVFVWIARML